MYFQTELRSRHFVYIHIYIAASFTIYIYLLFYYIFIIDYFTFINYNFIWRKEVCYGIVQDGRETSNSEHDTWIKRTQNNFIFSSIIMQLLINISTSTSRFVKPKNSKNKILLRILDNVQDLGKSSQTLKKIYKIKLLINHFSIFLAHKINKDQSLYNLFSYKCTCVDIIM